MSTSEYHYTEKVALPAEDASNATNYGGEKECTETITLVAFDAKEKDNARHYQDDARLRDVVTVRCWMGRSASASTVYASVWVHTRCGRWISGSGKAGGYGYCKTSAAIGVAFRSAGFDAKWAHQMSGTGMSVVREAMHRVADAAGYSRCAKTIVGA